MKPIHPTRRSFLVPTLLAVAGLTPGLIACHRDTGTTQLTSAAASATPGETAKQPIPDADIARAVQHHLEEDTALRSERVEATVTDGICTLTGTVRSLLAKERAIRVAETLRGVRAVVDRVDVMPVVRTDEQLRNDVTSALKSDTVTRAHPVTVAASDGKVTLSGVVASWPEKGIFEQVAKGVRGVKSIDNKLAVRYPLVPPQSQIAADVEHRIANDIWLEGSSIGVTVTDRTVHLKGIVGSVAEKNRARSDGWLAGVDDVDNSGVIVDWAKRDQQRSVIAYAFRPDSDIASAVHDAFNRDPRLVTLEPKVSVRDGIVELTGTVDSAKARRAAELDAKDTVGVAGVRNFAIVQPVGKPTDADINSSVKRALSEDLLLPDSPYIQSSTSKGKVVLKGEIKSGFERFDAVEDTASIPGVVEIVDDLSIKRSPQDIKADIDDRLYWDASVQRDRVKVTVGPDAVATLSGTLDNWSEVRAAVDDATWGGATKVVNALQLKKRPAH